IGAAPSQSYWVFQFLPDYENQNIESGGAGTKIDWRLTAYKDDVRIGDVVFFWRASGPRSALIGWGEVTGERFESVDEETLVVPGTGERFKSVEVYVSRIPVTTRVLF